MEAGRGEFAPAIRRYREVVERLPLPEYAIALGETEQAAGRLAAAKRDYALVGAEVKLLHANGVNTDVDLALFEANHGRLRARRQLRPARLAAGAERPLGRRLLAGPCTGPGGSGRATRFSEQAMRLGSRDPSFLYHAGMIALAAGRSEQARRLLGALVAQSPRFSPLYAPRAQRALEGLG